MRILDACCGSRLFWFDKDNEYTTYMDKRRETFEIHGKKINVQPDVVADFRDMPFPDNTYDLIVFDPPHLKWAGPNSIMKAQYGQLDKDTWPADILQGMTECMRVLKPNGVLIFKWNENQVKLKEVLQAIEPFRPLFGNRRSETHWLVFNKQKKPTSSANEVS
ncbi:class I SAM-dependent methyltransferase [Enterococcus olivae]